MACGQTETRWTFHLGEFDSEDVQALLAEHFRQMRSTSPPEACHVLPASGLRDPVISFWSLREAGDLLGIGALKELAPTHGEIKSMRTAGHALRRGVGAAMLGHIMSEARHRGYRRLSLETGSTAPFEAAIGLYQRAGFVPCAPFGEYRDTPFTRFFARDL